MLRPFLLITAFVAPVALGLSAPPVLANPTLPTPTVSPRVPPSKITEARIAPFVQATFDDVPVGTVDASYQPRGITFTCGGCATPHAYDAVENPLVTTQQNHVVSPYAGNVMPFFDERAGYIQATFTQACTSVSVLAQVVVGPEGNGSPTNRPYLKAYAANGQQVGSTTYGTPPGTSGAPPWQQLNVNSTTAAPITSIRFSVEHASGRSVQGMFDSVSCTY